MIEGIGPTKGRSCINEDGLPSAAIRFAADHGVIRTEPQMKKEGSPMEQYYVGLDVHSRQSTFVIEDGAGRVTAQGEVPTTPAGLAHLRAAHRLPPDTPVTLETGTVAFFVACQLAASGLLPQVIDADEVRLKAHRPTQKSDRRDAFELCEGLRRGSYRAIVHVPRAEVLRLLSRRRHFVRLPRAQLRTVKALLRR